MSYLCHPVEDLFRIDQLLWEISPQPGDHVGSTSQVAAEEGIVDLGDRTARAFEGAKAQLSSTCWLVHYNPTHELVLSSDASCYGLGAVLSHRQEDGLVKPIRFASRTLSPAEKRYSQVDQEGLAIVFGVSKFRQYFLGRHFTIYYYHKPVMHLMSVFQQEGGAGGARQVSTLL